MKLTSLKFEKPHWTHNRSDDRVWDFHAEWDTEFPHGYPVFGGILGKVTMTDGSIYWHAKQSSDDTWGPLKHTREEAVIAFAPIAFANIKRHVDAHKATEAAEKTRVNHAIELGKGLPPGIKVYHENHRDLDKPERFEIRVEGLSAVDVKKILGLIVQQ